MFENVCRAWRERRAAKIRQRDAKEGKIRLEHDRARFQGYLEIAHAATTAALMRGDRFFTIEQQLSYDWIMFARAVVKMANEVGVESLAFTNEVGEDNGSIRTRGAAIVTLPVEMVRDASDVRAA